MSITLWLLGEINVGQRCRELFGDNVFNIGFRPVPGLWPRRTNGMTPRSSWPWILPSKDRLNRCYPTLRMGILLWSRISSRSYTTEVHGSMRSCLSQQSTSSNVLAIIRDMLKYSNRISFLYVSRYQRFIGVIYRRRTEMTFRYSRCNAATQYDALAIIKISLGI